MSGRTKKRNTSPPNTKKSDVNTSLLQKRSKSSIVANGRNVFQKFNNKPCPKVDEWFFLIAKKNAMSTVQKFFHVVNEIKPGGKSQLGKKLAALEEKELGSCNTCGNALGFKGGGTSNQRNHLKNNHSLCLSSATTQQGGTSKQQSSIKFHMSQGLLKHGRTCQGKHL